MGVLDGAGAGPAAVGMHDETDVAQILPFDQVDDVGDVGVEDDVLAQQMLAVAIAGERRRVDLVALGLQEVRHPPPAPATMPGAVNEHEGLACAGLRHRLRVA